MTEPEIVYAIIDSRDGSVVDVAITRKSARELLLEHTHRDISALRVRRAKLTLFK